MLFRWLAVGWEINVPFQHKNRLYRGQGRGWRFSSARLRMANDTVTSRPRCLFVQRRPNRIGEAHLSYYASAYNRVETNQPPQDLFISSCDISHNCCPSVPITYQCITSLVVWYLFRVSLALECFP